MIDKLTKKQKNVAIKLRENIIDRLTAELAEARETINLLSRSFEAAEFKRLRYREALEILSAIFFYGGFIAETFHERALQRILEEVGLWPTTEDAIIKRRAAREALEE